MKDDALVPVVVPAVRSESEDVNVLRNAVALRRRRLQASTDRLRREVRREVDWRFWYRRYPGGFLTAALVLGWTVGKWGQPSHRR